MREKRDECGNAEEFKPNVWFRHEHKPMRIRVENGHGDIYGHDYPVFVIFFIVKVIVKYMRSISWIIVLL